MRNRFGYLLGLLTAAVLCGLALADPSTSASFPGAMSLPDPSGRWVIEWREATPTSAHALLLRNREGGDSLQLLEFNRSVDVA